MSKKIPIPKPGVVRNKAREALLLSIKLKEDKYFPMKIFNDVNKLRSALTQIKKKYGRRFVTRTETNGLRIWRVK